MVLQYNTVFEQLRSAAMNFVISVLINGSKGLGSSIRECIPQGPANSNYDGVVDGSQYC